MPIAMQRTVYRSACPGTAPDFTALATSSETITLDDLNQVLLALQEHEDLIPNLKRVLKAIAEHDTYHAWKSSYQYEEFLYRLPPDLTFQTDAQRRLLETLFLVKDDVLRVRVNRSGSYIFITDGFWVPASIRVFPDIDESDLLIRRCRELGLMDWPTAVIDVASGCGHTGAAV